MTHQAAYKTIMLAVRAADELAEKYKQDYFVTKNPDIDEYLVQSLYEVALDARASAEDVYWTVQDHLEEYYMYSTDIYSTGEYDLECEPTSEEVYDILFDNGDYEIDADYHGRGLTATFNIKIHSNWPDILLDALREQEDMNKEDSYANGISHQYEIDKVVDDIFWRTLNDALENFVYECMEKNNNWISTWEQTGHSGGHLQLTLNWPSSIRETLELSAVLDNIYIQIEDIRKYLRAESYWREEIICYLDLSENTIKLLEAGTEENLHIFGEYKDTAPNRSSQHVHVIVSLCSGIVDDIRVFQDTDNAREVYTGAMMSNDSDKFETYWLVTPLE